MICVLWHTAIDTRHSHLFTHVSNEAQPDITIWTAIDRWQLIELIVFLLAKCHLINNHHSIRVNFEINVAHNSSSSSSLASAMGHYPIESNDFDSDNESETLWWFSGKQPKGQIQSSHRILKWRWLNVLIQAIHERSCCCCCCFCSHKSWCVHYVHIHKSAYYFSTRMSDVRKLI